MKVWDLKKCAGVFFRVGVGFYFSCDRYVL